MVLGLSTSVLIRSLEPATLYECNVVASTRAGHGQPARGMFWTKPNSEINTDNYLEDKIPKNLKKKFRYIYLIVLMLR